MSDKKVTKTLFGDYKYAEDEDIIINKIETSTNAVIRFKDCIDGLRDDITYADEEIEELKEKIEDLEENQKEDGTIEFPYLYVNDQFKCDLLLENWDKFKEEDIVEMLKGKR